MKNRFHFDISYSRSAELALAGYCARAGNGVEAGQIGSITTGY